MHNGIAALSGARIPKIIVAVVKSCPTKIPVQREQIGY